MNKELRNGLRTWIEIDKRAIAHNYQVFRGLIPKKTKLMGVVKSNAYGHNLLEFSRELEKLGVDWLGVDSVVEGLALRQGGVKKPILILGYTLSEMIEKAAENDLSLTISNFEYFQAVKNAKLKKAVKVHIKVDTGMHRHGWRESDIKKVITTLKENSGLIAVEGLYTHFASAKNPAFPKETKEQIGSFNHWKIALHEAGFGPISHAGATAGTILFPEAHLDMVRVGIGLYGIWPSREARAFAEDKFKLQPVLSWRTVIGEINNLKAGERIGYDFTEGVSRNSKVAILPIGYWHGFPRALSSIGRVIVRGQKAKVLGRVCMDIVMVDVTDIKGAKAGDVVTIIGQDEKTVITADDLATLLDASPYEIVTRINPLIKRIYC